MTGARGSGARVRLVRHAQASFGSADYDQLSARGLQQAQHLARWLAAEARRPYGLVVRGSMLRHAQTLLSNRVPQSGRFHASGRIRCK